MHKEKKPYIIIGVLYMPFADIKQIMLISYHYMLLINKLVKKYNFKRRVAARNFIFYGLRFA